MRRADPPLLPRAKKPDVELGVYASPAPSRAPTLPPKDSRAYPVPGPSKSAIPYGHPPKTPAPARLAKSHHRSPSNPSPRSPLSSPSKHGVIPEEVLHSPPRDYNRPQPPTMSPQWSTAAVAGDGFSVVSASMSPPPPPQPQLYSPPSQSYSPYAQPQTQYFAQPQAQPYYRDDVPPSERIRQHLASHPTPYAQANPLPRAPEDPGRMLVQQAQARGEDYTRRTGELLAAAAAAAASEASGKEREREERRERVRTRSGSGHRHGHGHGRTSSSGHGHGHRHGRSVSRDEAYGGAEVIAAYGQPYAPSASGGGWV